MFWQPRTVMCCFFKTKLGLWRFAVSDKFYNDVSIYLNVVCPIRPTVLAQQIHCRIPPPTHPSIIVFLELLCNLISFAVHRIIIKLYALVFLTSILLFNFVFSSSPQHMVFGGDLDLLFQTHYPLVLTACHNSLFHNNVHLLCHWADSVIPTVLSLNSTDLHSAKATREMRVATIR